MPTETDKPQAINNKTRHGLQNQNKLVSTAVIFVTALVVLTTAWLFLVLQNRSGGCSSFEAKANQLIRDGKNKELVQFYKTSHETCGEKAAGRSKLNPVDKIDLYRAVSFSALQDSDDKLSRESAKKGLAVYDNLPAEQKQQLEGSAILFDLRDLEKGEY